MTTSVDAEIPLLTVENFSFEPEIDTNNYKTAHTDMVLVSSDVSKGTEAMPIPAYVRSSYPPECLVAPDLQYINRIAPSENAFKQLKLSLNKEMMPCCDCTDCSNTETCQCVIRMKEVVNRRKKHKRLKGDQDIKVGYRNRRLIDGRPGIGIVECGPNCHCMKNQKYNLPCGNRVVQCGIRQVMYLELMPIKGWGVITKYDIPAGTFISTYSAKMYTSNEADEVGKKYGDTFLCDLDYIEVAEKYKGELQGNAIESAYESGSESDNPVEVAPTPVPQSTARSRTPTEPAATSENQRNLRQRNRSGLRSTDKLSKKTSYTEHTFSLDDTAKSVPKDQTLPDLTQDVTACISKTRKWYLDQEDREIEEITDDLVDKFVLDAMSHGNVGRFFNHSCDPNMQILNTFTYGGGLVFVACGIVLTKLLVQCNKEFLRMTGQKRASEIN